MSQCATHATQNDMTTSSDTWRKIEKDTFLWLPPKTRQLYPHDGRAHSFLLTHVECHSVPLMPRKTTWPHLLTRGERLRKTRSCGFPQRHANSTLTTVAHTHSSSHTSNVTVCHACHTKRHDHIFWHVEKDWERHVFVASPKDTPTLPSRRSRTHIPPHTHRMSQSATPATQNDMNGKHTTYIFVDLGDFYSCFAHIIWRFRHPNINGLKGKILTRKPHISGKIDGRSMVSGEDVPFPIWSDFLSKRGLPQPSSIDSVPAELWSPLIGNVPARVASGRGETGGEKKHTRLISNHFYSFRITSNNFQSFLISFQISNF